MTQMLYYIAGRPNKERIQSVLSGRFEGEIAQRTVVKGPGGEPTGEIISSGDERLELNLENQTWTQSGDKSFWFGWWNDSKPTPGDLRRKEIVPGDPLNGWIVPRVRKWELENESNICYPALPQRIKWDGQQFVPGGVVERFVPLSELGSIVHQRLSAMYQAGYEDPENRTVLPTDAGELAAQILCVNHRVGQDELAALDAFEFSFQSIAQILRVFVSWDQFEELLAQRLEKKTELVSA